MIVRFHKSHLFNLPGCHSQVIGRSLTSVTVQSEPRSVIVEEMPPRMPPDLPFHFRLDVSWARDGERVFYWFGGLKGWPSCDHDEVALRSEP